MSFQDSLALGIFLIYNLYNYVILLVVLIGGYVFIIGYFIKSNSVNVVHYGSQHWIEFIWTVIPAVLLAVLAIPSLQVLYFLDEVSDPRLTIKVTGHQWYWSYEYGEADLKFDSYIVSDDILNLGDRRLIEVDNRLILPRGLEIRFLITAADVLHSWGVPSLGIKSDAIPGRLNQAVLLTDRCFVAFGGCYELCGNGHRNMPVVIEIIPLRDWTTWYNEIINQ